MTPSVFLPAATSLFALVFAIALLDQWRERRYGFQLIWAIGMLFFAVAAGCEAIAAAGGWNEALYRTWYLTGAVWTAGWLGLGTAFLLGRTRFGYTFAFALLVAGVLTLLTQRRFDYPGAGTAPILYLIGAIVLAIAVAVETYFQNERWPMLAAGAVVGATLVSLVLMVLTPLAAPGYALDPRTGVPTGELFPGTIRLLTPFLNITGSIALVLGAVFSTYVFMPKKRVLGVFARSKPARRPIPVQPPDRPGRDRREPRRVIAVHRAGAPRRSDPQPCAGDDAHRDRGVHPARHGLDEPAWLDRVLPDRQVPRRRLPLRRVPRLGRDVPRDPDPVHRYPPPPAPQRVRALDHGRRRSRGPARGSLTADPGWPRVPDRAEPRQRRSTRAARTMPGCANAHCWSDP